MVVSQAMAVPVTSRCLNEVSKAVMKSANDPNNMVIPEIQEVQKVVTHLFLVGVVYHFIYDEIKLDSVHPCVGFVKRAIKGFWGSEMKFSGFCSGHGRGGWWWWGWWGNEDLSSRVGRQRWRGGSARKSEGG